MKEWLWVTTYSNYFTIYNLSKQRKAYDKFQNFIYKNDNPIYLDTLNKNFNTESFPSKISMGSVRGKALALFMINFLINENVFLSKVTLNVENVTNIKIYKLFKDYNSSENTIYVIEEYNLIDNFPKSVKDVSFMLLMENKGKYSEYFITDEMREVYAKGNIKNVLESRKELIMKEERKFVESLDIYYTDPFLPW